MSAEFFIPYSNSSIETAIENMEKTMSSFDYATQYALEIQEAYASMPNGDNELGKMVHAAQYIANRQTDDAGEEVQAIYHGELLGLGFINYLKPDDGVLHKTGYAESFIQFHIGLDQLSYAGPSNEETLSSRLSKSIQLDLSQPMQEHGLRPIYEEFGKKVTSKLSDEPAHQELAMMGFRMIVIEALKQKRAPRTIADLEKEYIPSIEETEAIIGNQEWIQFPEWVNISNIREIIYKKYCELSSLNEEDQLSNHSAPASVDRYTEERLMEFALENGCIDMGDLLSVRGEFFGTSGKGYQFLYNEFIEVRGIFDGIRVVETPSNKYLQKLADPENTSDIENDTEHFIKSVSLRIVDPKFIFDNKHGIKMPQPDDQKIIYIPLNYSAVTFKRLKATELEPEA